MSEIGQTCFIQTKNFMKIELSNDQFLNYSEKISLFSHV